MKQPRVRVPFAATVLALLAIPAMGQAQSPDCATRPSRGIGISAGKGSPYFEFSRGVAAEAGGGSFLVRGGPQLAGRLDLPVAGAWRARLEASFARWRVDRQTYSPDLQQVSKESAGEVAARQMVAMVGRQGGRAPVCGYVLAGGGLYSLDVLGTAVRGPGVALTAGVEIPAGDRSAVQADVQLQVISSRSRHPIGSSDVLAASLVVGWSYRF